jgi:hypothetical protein
MQSNSLITLAECRKNTGEIRTANMDRITVLGKLDESIVKSFMDIIVLKRLEHEHPMSGYDAINYFHKKFQMLLSPGIVYSVLYSLERQI